MCMSYSAPADRQQFFMHDKQKHEWDIAIKYCKKPNLKDVKVRCSDSCTSEIISAGVRRVRPHVLARVNVPLTEIDDVLLLLFHAC